MNLNEIYNIKFSFLCCSDKILLNLQISKKHTLEEIIILELKFGTKRKNRKIRPISRTSGIESNHSGYGSIIDVYFELLIESHMKLRIQAL